MFDFIFDMNNYEERKVDRYEEDDLIVDTARVSDGRQPYETAVAHPKYNDGKWVIVEAYSTKGAAQDGHNRWVETMTNNPPDTLVGCANSNIQSLLGEQEYDRDDEDVDDLFFYV